MPVAVGIDVAKEFHWAAAADERAGELLFDGRIDNQPGSIQALVDRLSRLRDERRPIRVGIDVVGGIASLLAAMLHEAGLEHSLQLASDAVAVGVRADADVCREGGKAGGDSSRREVVHLDDVCVSGHPLADLLRVDPSRRRLE